MHSNAAITLQIKVTLVPKCEVWYTVYLPSVLHLVTVFSDKMYACVSSMSRMPLVSHTLSRSEFARQAVGSRDPVGAPGSKCRA